MYYCLHEDFMLCSYQGLPYGLRNTKTNQLVFYGSKENYMLLYKCNGKVNFDAVSPDADRQKFLDDLVRQGVLKTFDTPHPLPGPIPGRIYDNRYRKSVQWSVTGMCNYRCRHCFQSAPEGKLGQPSLEELLDVIRQFDECGITDVSITGGEPLIRSDLFEIIDALIAHNIRVTTIYSNGALIDETFLKKLEDRGIKPAFQISFDGVGWHDWIRGIPGAEKLALDAIRLLKAHGFQVSSAFVLCRENSPVLLESIRLLEKLGVSGMKIQRCMPQGEWRMQKEHYLGDDELLEIYMALLEDICRAGVGMPVQMEGVYSVRRLENENKYSLRVGYDRNLTEEEYQKAPGCGVTLQSFFVGPNGAVVPCMSMCGASVEALFPNLFRTPLKKILTDSTYMVCSQATVKEIIEHNEACRDCRYAHHCGGGKCRAGAIGDSGTDYYCLDAFICRIYQSGWDRKLREKMDRLAAEFGAESEEDSGGRRSETEPAQKKTPLREADLAQAAGGAADKKKIRQYGGTDDPYDISDILKTVGPAASHSGPVPNAADRKGDPNG